jgi:hypothetical protein
LIVWLPEVALLPDQAPDAVQEVALVEDQVRVDDPPLVTDAGLAVRETLGANVTVTVVDALCVPPAPVQERLKVLLLVSAPVDALPEVALLPDQAPDAVQEVALVEDQLRVDDPPLVTDVGFAEIDTVGAGGGGGVFVTLTWAERLALPFGPLQVSEKLLLVLSGPVDWLPEVALLPDHAPVATHDTVFVELHVSVETPPLATDVGFAIRDTDGPSPTNTGASPASPAGGSVSLAPQAASRSVETNRRCLGRKVGPHSPTAGRGSGRVTLSSFLLSLTCPVHREDKSPRIDPCEKPLH